MNSPVPIKRALLSVSDKAGLVDLAKNLVEFGTEILSTGGSAKILRDAGIPVREVADYTGFPEMMDGRVKTLHPKIHGGLLALRDEDSHKKAMADHDIGAIDLVAINLYPFEETVEKGEKFATVIENIDIGGPAMIRSAAKNHAYVTVLTDPKDYESVIQELVETGGTTSGALRKTLAAKAYARTGSYDAAIASWFQKQGGDDYPERLVLAATRGQTLRYGENPHQSAALYRRRDDKRIGVATAVQLQGKELSYNNLNDTDAAFELVSEFDRGKPGVAIIKHANPCGAAYGETLKDAYMKALACDPVSAFGGIIALNQPLDAETATEIAKIFTEVIIAPAIDKGAREILAAKKNLRLLETGGLADPEQAGRVIKSIAGGYLVQDRDYGRITRDDLKIVTRKKPGVQELDDLLFAFLICKHVKSNAIIYVKNGAAVGIGAGQMSRVDSVKIAASKAQDAADVAGKNSPATMGSVVASDAFFPFADGLFAAANAGATAVIQPGGSMRDAEVIAAADEQGLAMVFTGMRHFRH